MSTDKYSMSNFIPAFFSFLYTHFLRAIKYFIKLLFYFVNFTNLKIIRMLIWYDKHKEHTYKTRKKKNLYLTRNLVQ